MQVSSRPALSLLERAGVWFLRSGIKEPNGGVARYYRTDVKQNAPVSTEITGYAVSAFAYLFEQTGGAEYLEASKQCARFLRHEAWDAKLAIFPFEQPATAGGEALAYFFDSGIIARGFLALWRITRDSEYLVSACEAGLSMIRDFDGGSAFHPVLDLPSKRPLEYEPRWSRSPGCYQLKSALAWHDLAEVTGDEQFLDAWGKALGQALQSHRTFLPGETPEKTMDRLHAYSYFLEALLAEPEREECRTALAEGIFRVERLLRALAPVFVRSDVYAQLLRVRLWADQSGMVRLDEAAAAHEASAIPGFQSEAEDETFEGGFYFGCKQGESLPYLNPVSGAFCLQAWQMWQERMAGSLATSRRALI